MRNLKRALSLTLASVMLLGMMVVGSSAAGYPDVSEEENIEAIEVLQAVGVMGGDENGNFNPDDYVTREQMAVIMAQLLKLDYNYYKGTNPFSDVPEWAAPYVAACAANGVTAGIGGGLYGSKQNIQAVQAALMMLKALGYFQYAGDYGDSYVLATVKQGTEIGLFDGIDSNADSALTRNQVAQMALNALKADMVTFTGDPGMEYTGTNGEKWVGGYRAEYTPRTSTLAKYQAIERRSSDVSGDANHRGQYYIQLGEELYDGDLKLYDSRTDDFGRPSRYWEYDGKAIGTYVKKELLKQEWTVEVTGKDFYDLLGSDVIKDYTFDVTIDGVSIDEKTGTTDNNTVLKDKSDKTKANSYFDETYMAKTYKTGVGQTGKGVLTQVFVDPDSKQVDIAVINTYLAKATADYSEKKDELSLKVYALTSNGASGSNEVFYKYPDACKTDGETGQFKTLKVSSEDFDVAGVKKDEIFLVTAANGEIQTMAEPQVISSASLDAFSLNKYVVSGGTQYDYNTTIDYDPDVLEDYTSQSAGEKLKDIEYNLYLDAYGYLIGVEVVEATKNYIFLTGIDQGTSNLNNKVSEAAGILLDGTFINFKMNMTDSRTSEQVTNANPTGGKTFFGHPLWNTWCTYTVDKDGNYTLKEVKTSPNFASGNDKAGQYHDLKENAKKIDAKRVALPASGTTYAYGNDDSIYIIPETKTVAARDEVKTGFNVPSDTNTPTAIAGDVDEGDKVIIISGTDDVVTGIENVSVTTWKEAEIKSNTENSTSVEAWPGNIYTLYDNKGYIIAAVVVGEGDGSSKNLVYVSSDKTKEEWYSAADDEHTWTREVIANGTIGDLKEIGSGLSKLKEMKQYAWYEVTYKADGSVKSVDLAYYSEGNGKLIGGVADPASNGHKLTRGYTGNINNASFIDNVTYVEAMNVDGKSTYLYEEVWGLGNDDNNVSTGSAPGNSETSPKTQMRENNQPSLKLGTLYVDTKAQKGFRVNDDVKCYLIQTNDGKTTTDSGVGTSDLERMLDRLNYDSENGTYLFKISAIITNAHATTVVIHDWVGTTAQTSGTHSGGGGNEDVNGVTIEGGRIVVTSNETDDGDGAIVRSKLITYLENDGYTVLTINAATTGSVGAEYPVDYANFQIVASKGGNTYTFNSDLVIMIPVYLDSETKTDVKQGTVLNITAPGTGHLVGAAASAVAPGAAATTTTTAGAAGYHAGAYTVTWADRNNYIRTNVFAVDVDGSGTDNNYFKEGDEATLAASVRGGNWAKYNNGTKDQYVALSGDDKDTFTVKADMAGKQVTGGYYKVTPKTGDPEYIKDNETTTADMGATASTWIKTDKGFVQVSATKKINGASLDGATAKITDDITVLDTVGYRKITAPKDTNAGANLDTTTGKYTYAITVNSKGEIVAGTTGNTIYVQDDAQITITFTWTSEDVTDGGGANKKDKIAVALTGATLDPVGGVAEFEAKAFADATDADKVKTVKITAVTSSSEGQTLTITGSNEA